MKTLFRLAVIAALCLPAFGQTGTVWFPIVTLSGNQNPLVTTAAAVTYRFGTDTGTTLKGVNCATAPGCWLAPVTAKLTNFPTLWSTFPSDPASGISKFFEIAETAVVQTGTVGGVAFTVPALPAPPPPPTPTPVGSPVAAMAQLMSDGTYVVTLSAKVTVVPQ